MPDGSALLSGLTPIEEANERFGLSLSDPNYETIAGYILGRLDRIAQLGDTVEADGVDLTVAAMDGLRIDRVRLTPRPPAARNPAADPAPAPREARLDDAAPSP